MDFTTMKTLGLAVVFGLLLRTPAALSQAPEGESPHPLTVFDISALVKPVKDFPGPRFELSSGKALESMMREVPDALNEDLESHRPTLMTTIDLEELIKESDSVWSSNPGKIRLSIINNRLYVQGPKEAVDRLRALLRVLEKEASRSFLIRAVVVQVPKGTGGELLGKPGTVMVEAAAKKRLANLPKKGGKTLADASIGALNGQRVHLVDGREKTFLVDYDIILAKEAAAADPIVEVFRDGLILDVRPTASPTGESVRLDLFVGFTRFDSETLRFNPENPKLGPLDLPKLTGFRMESSVAVPRGHTLLLGPLMPSPALQGTSSREGGILPGKKGEEEGKGTPGAGESKGDVFLLMQVKEIAK
ncbi:MAG: hypothetical protein ACYTHM_04980 [Planctomycetota bacterium]|jgi:hypothetical protein